MEEEQTENQLESFEEDFGDNSFPGEKPNKFEILKTKIRNNRKIILFFVAITLLIAISLIACASILIPVLVTTGSHNNNNGHNNDNDTQQTQPLYDDSDDYYFNGTDPAIACCFDDFPYHDKIWNTIEYQVGLEQVSKFKDRQKECDVYLSKFSALSGLDFTFANGNQSVRDEYDLKTPNCGYSTEVRVRIYISGPKEGFTTVDSKMNGHSQQDAYDSPLYPSHAQAATSYQKAEQGLFFPLPFLFFFKINKITKDQHECTSKWARETRCLLPSPFSFTTCQSVLDLYPGIYPDIPEEKKSATVSTGSTAHWWILEHTTTQFPTVLRNGTTVYSKMDSTFTLQYNSQSDAISGKATPSYGEWSFRLYAASVGPSNQINSEVSSECLTIYKAMVSEFETDPGC